MKVTENLPEVESLGEIFALPGPIAEDAMLLDDSRAYSQLVFAFEDGGEYVIADAINVLEKYYGVFALNDKRCEEIIKFLEAHQQTPRGSRSHLIDCHLMSALIRMSLEREVPDFNATDLLLHAFERIHFTLPSRERPKQIRIACTVLRDSLKDACGREYFPHVRRFLAQLSNHTRTISYNDELRNIFVSGGFINF